jgi:hypothetical protein
MAADGEAVAVKIAIFGSAGFKGCRVLERLALEQPKTGLIPSDIAAASPALIFKLTTLHTMA